MLTEQGLTVLTLEQEAYFASTHFRYPDHLEERINRSNLQKPYADFCRTVLGRVPFKLIVDRECYASHDSYTILNQGFMCHAVALDRIDKTHIADYSWRYFNEAFKSKLSKIKNSSDGEQADRLLALSKDIMDEFLQMPVLEYISFSRN